MTGKRSSCCSVIFYWKEIIPCRVTVLCLMVWLHWRRQPLLMPLQGNIAGRRYRQQEKVREWAWWEEGSSCVGCQILSILHISPRFCFSVLLCPPPCHTSYLSQTLQKHKQIQTTFINYTRCNSTSSLLGKWANTIPHPAPTPCLPRSHCWRICLHRLQTGGIRVAYLSFVCVQPGRHPAKMIWTPDLYR